MLFDILDRHREQISRLEHKISELKKSHKNEILMIKRHFAKIKSSQELSSLMLSGELTYTDLSPQKAIEIYRNQNLKYQILDITEESDRPDFKLEGVQYIPFSQLENRYQELENSSYPILVISNKGLKSILACEFLTKKGYLNINNVSGGYQFWGKTQDNSFKLSA